MNGAGAETPKAWESRVVSLGVRLPMFPLSTVLFPCTRIPLHVFEPRYQALVGACLSVDPHLGVVLIARGSEVGGGDERFDVGTVARLVTAQPLPGGRWYVEVEGVDRMRIRAWHDDRPYPAATVEDWPAPAAPTRAELLAEAESEVRRVWALLSELGQATPIGWDRAPDDDPRTAVWQLCAAAPLGALDRQRLLAAPGPDERVATLLDLVGAVGRDALALLGGA